MLAWLNDLVADFETQELGAVILDKAECRFDVSFGGHNDLYDE